MSRRSPQSDMFAKFPSAYGGDLLTKRRARIHGRPVSVRYSMHFVLRSSQARGDWSFWRHRSVIEKVIRKFAQKFGVKLNSMANVGNQLHLHLQLTNPRAYAGFIRAISSAIMMRVTGISRWKKSKTKTKFWDRRPFSRILIGRTAVLRIKDYLMINRMQGYGFAKTSARFFVLWNRAAYISQA